MRRCAAASSGARAGGRRFRTRVYAPCRIVLKSSFMLLMLSKGWILHQPKETASSAANASVGGRVDRQRLRPSARRFWMVFSDQ